MLIPAPVFASELSASMRSIVDAASGRSMHIVVPFTTVEAAAP